MFYTILTTLGNYMVINGDQSVVASLTAKVASQTPEGLVDEVGITNMVAAFFTANPNQFAKLPQVPLWPYSPHGYLSNSLATDDEINTWWADESAITGYADTPQGRQDYVRDVFVNIKASPTTPYSVNGTTFVSLGVNSKYTLVNGEPRL
jgi:hypothetical protein